MKTVRTTHATDALSTLGLHTSGLNSAAREGAVHHAGRPEPHLSSPTATRAPSIASGNLVQRMRRVLADVRVLMDAPKITINLMLDKTAGNDPFFREVVLKHYHEVSRRHPRYFFVPRVKYGVALHQLPKSYDAYLKAITKTARQNINKAARAGYTVQRINYNDHLADVAEINRSTEFRQGPMSADFLVHDPKPIADPPSRTNVHDYVYYGVMKSGKLYAYSSALISGEGMIMTIIFGHAGYLTDGIVPLLLSGMAADAYARFPRVKYFVYDMYFGGSEGFRRFKRKFRFEPHTVTWKL